jgi:Tfp pilus assembly protein PilV
MTRHATTGFALIDALIALLLFAVVLLAAMAALLKGMHAMHDAALTGAAVDRAADLLEAVRAQPSGAPLQAVLDSWTSAVDSTLPADAKGQALALVQPLLASIGAAP